MKWIMALNEKSADYPQGDSYELMAQVAVYSAKLNAPSLDPYLIWNGEPSAYTETMESLGVTVIPHKLSIENEVNACGNRSKQWKHTASGAMLRLDLPSIFSGLDETILYTDVDVMFLDDPGKYYLATNSFAFSSEFDMHDFVNINTGVMLLNLSKSKEAFTQLRSWTQDNLTWIPDFDQGAIRMFFNGNWDRLDPRLNWKPYWSVKPDQILVHFHGPKPTDFDPITLHPRFDVNIDHIYATLYKNAKASYKFYLCKWLRFANDCFG